MFNDIQPLLDKFNQMNSSDLNPIIIYHYAPPSAFLNIFKENKLWFSDRRFLNDQSEGINALDVLAKVLPTAIISETLRQYLIEKCAQKKKNFSSDGLNFFVVSFSTDKDNLNLWNYYSKNNRLLGYNIGFEKNELLAAYREPTANVTPVKPIYGSVIYNDSEKYDFVKDIVEIMYSAGTGIHYEIVGDQILDRVVFSGCLFKHEAFKNELEYRIVIPWNPNWANNGTNVPEIKFREKDGFFIPYMPIHFEIGRCVKNVTVSPTINHDLAEVSLKMMFRKYPRIEIRHSSIPVRY